jgi:hypothetical protein
MTPKEWLIRLITSKRAYEQQRVNLALKAGHDLLALIKLRNQTRGVDAQGVKYVPYTKDYAKRGRLDKGYQAEYVDFTRTGRMWNNIKVKSAQVTNDSTFLVIRADLAQEQAKLNGQAKKRGNILTPSVQEITLVQTLHKNRILDTIKIN